MIKYIKRGDIFNIENVFNYAHGCNCSGAMGKGIAIQFRKKFPDMYMEYKKMCNQGSFTLGEVFEFNYGKGFIYNLGTQKSWKSRANITAIEKSINKMLSIAEERKITSIAMPKIGAGLGGLEWENVKTVIENISSHHNKVSLYIVESYCNNKSLK